MNCQDTSYQKGTKKSFTKLYNHVNFKYFEFFRKNPF